MNQTDRLALLDAAHALAQTARETILEKVQAGFRIDRKPDGTYLTEADLATEKALREGIAARFPDHGIVGEELPPVNPDSEFQWILDPIDGTHSFSKGIPLYGVLIALRYRQEPTLGIIDLPGLQERTSAARGLGAWCNGRRLRLEEDDAPLEEQLIATGERSQFVRVNKTDVFERIVQTFPHVRTYSDAFGHCLAARGAVSAMVDYGLKLWDMAATEVIIPEAGGRFELVERQGDNYNVIFGRNRLVSALLRAQG